MALFGSLATLRAQTGNSAKFQAAFAYLDDLLRTGSDASKRVRLISEGKTDRLELTGGAFALEQVYRTKARSEGVFESHRAYIDVQVVFAGEEFIEVQDITALKLKEDRTPAQDVMLYQPKTKASALHLKAGDAAILYPIDGHMPCIAVDTPMIVRKIVVKVPVG